VTMYKLSEGQGVFVV